MQKLADLADIAPDRPFKAKLGDTDIILVRDGDTVRAFQGKCPHAEAPLADGAVCDGRIVCPWHKAQFAIGDGAVLEPPALAPLARYPVTVDSDGAVRVGEEAVTPAAPDPAPDPRRVAIVGFGAAGAAAAAGLREFGFGGTITAIEPDSAAPYDRTSLSKMVMAGKMDPADVPPLLSPEQRDALRIDRIPGTATRLDGKHLGLDDGRTVPFDAVIVATGSTPTRPDLPGAGLDGVHVLRSAAHAAAIVGSVAEAKRAVILGSSFIGLEVASGLRQRKLDVHVFTPDAVPFGKNFGPELGAVFRALHESKGVVFHTETKPARIEGDGKAERVVLDDGTVLAADLVVAGTGVEPATGWLDGLPTAKDGGIEVDVALRAAEGIYAVGDIAQFPLPGSGAVRIEHWRLAQQHARTAARDIAAGPARYDGVPFFWTAHYGKRFDYLGHAEQWDDIAIDGDLTEPKFIAYFVKDGHVAAVLACQRDDATTKLIVRMRNKLTLDEARAVAKGS